MLECLSVANFGRSTIGDRSPIHPDAETEQRLISTVSHDEG